MRAGEIFNMKSYDVDLKMVSSIFPILKMGRVGGPI